MAAPTLGGVALGNVETIRFQLIADIEVITLPGDDSTGTINFDFGGVEREVNIQGTMTGATTAAVKSQVDAIEALIDGDQASSFAFISDVLGTIQVKIKSFDVQWNVPQNRVAYTLIITEGT